jgi:SAM-dependent methyltransferase
VAAVEATEIRKLAALEDTHWWYRERRALLARWLRRLSAAGVAPGRALDVGAAGGGNTRVLRAHGWRPVALEYSPDGAEVARDRGLPVIRADARHLPLPSAGLDLVVAFDILEHIEEDHLAGAEIRRVLRPGGSALIAVPCDMRLWSAHDVAVGHVRRYDRAGLVRLMAKSGLEVDEVWSWNILLRPVVAWRRRRSTGSDLDTLPAVVNLGLTTIIAAERYLPVRRLPGVSLMLRARRPA